MNKKILIGIGILALVAVVFLALIEEKPQGSQDPTKVNTAGWEDSTYISPDGQRLYFMYSQYDLAEFLNGKFVKVGPKRPGHHSDPAWASVLMDADIYVSERQADGSWGEPKNMGFNTVLDESSGMVSYNGEEFYLGVGPNIPGMSIPEGEEEYWDWEIYVSKKQNGKWGKPVNLGPPVNTKSPPEGGFGYSEGNPHISKENILYFEADHAYDGTEHFGGFDLYYSTRNSDGSWSQPKNMGSNINSEYDEMTAWVDIDGFTGNLTAHFTRFIKEDLDKWWILGGIIELQIHKSEFIDGKWKKAERVELDPIAQGELSLTEDGRFAYFNAGINNLDIWFSERQPDGSWGRPKPVD